MLSQELIQQVAKNEKVKPQFLKQQLNQGRAVILFNRNHPNCQPMAVGEGLKVKINTNLGLSTKKTDIKAELKKLRVALASGTDTIMDLSVSPNLGALRRMLLRQCPKPLGTVPLYEAAVEVERRKGDINRMTFDDLWDVLNLQAKEGVDFFTIHAGILKKYVQGLKTKKRVCGIVSRGGSLLAQWMLKNKTENLFYTNFDKILALAKAYNITVSLGDALRPGAIADSTDKPQLAELRTLGRLVKRCRQKNVQVIVEGPGHIRLDEIATNMFLEKKLCHNAPFYVLGPLPIDIASGYDHISSAIGGALAAFYGASFLCVVTPAEHLRHPSAEDIKDGVIASKIAAHSVDVLRFKDEWKRDLTLSLHRSKRQWQKVFPLTIDEKKARLYRKDLRVSEDICSMCGSFCSMKISEKCNLLK
ncbi:MAG: phosphomethylpyrimidine synthase ThiC [Candidatus Omnitrophica bacterium]|nr:phosphomethylpyrimidine synthase ThiC [Candidatus Omnitrophota bacterium]MBU2265942.1 phosphomethylpyrimidine synthase ThiC [Candidatus Omnitrophota bacterium]MBU2474099.1 phosphomethylpyrimidine synthase ThiC [Candidatus Omnitrophota bacterium]